MLGCSSPIVMMILKPDWPILRITKVVHIHTIVVAIPKQTKSYGLQWNEKGLLKGLYTNWI